MLVRRGDEDGEELHVFLAQHIVCASPDKNALFVAGNAADLVALQGEKHLARRLAAQHVVVALVYRLKKVGVGRLFV